MCPLDGAATTVTTARIEIKPPKPRRHTTGGTQQTAEDIRLAKELAAEMNGTTILNDYDQEIDPNSTLGRKQLISMLKQRYGPEMEPFRTSGEISEKERIRRDRQRERDTRHDQKMAQENREMNHHGGVHHSPHVNSSREHRHVSSSEGSEDLSNQSSPDVRRAVITKTTTTTHHNTTRKYHSDEDTYKDKIINCGSSYSFDGIENKNTSKDVVFLQYRDEVKRVVLPSTVSSLDTLKALFVNAFPGRIAMPHFEEGYKTIYIKDMETGVYYHLEAISEVVNRSFMKIHEQEIISDTLSEVGYDHRSQTLPNQGRDYAESLQDFELTAPRLRRAGSGSSLRSDNVFTRPTYVQNRSTYSYVQDGHPRVQDVHTRVQSGHTRIENVAEDKQKQAQFSPVLKKKPETTLAKATTVQDQLDDLTDLLKTALKEEDDHHAAVMTECVGTKHPGKLDQHLIDDLQNKTETMARKKSLPKHFQPTVIVMAQQETDRRTPIEDDSQITPPSPKKVNKETKIKTSSSVKMTINKVNKTEQNLSITAHSVNKQDNRLDNKEDKTDNSTLQTRQNTRVEEGFISPANRQYYEYSSVTQATKDTNIKNTDITPPSPKVKNTSEKMEVTQQAVVEELNYSSAIADELLSQLMDLEEEVKQRSSRTSSTHNSRRSSNASTSSKSSVTITTPKKRTGSGSSAIAEDPSRHPRHVSSSSVQATSSRATEEYLRKPRVMTVPESSSTHVYASVSKVTSLNGTGNYQQKTNDTVFSETTDGGKLVTTETTQETTVKKTATGEICNKPSLTTPDFFELEDTAQHVQVSLQGLRQELAEMRKSYTDSSKSFKADIQKKLLEFRKKAARVDEHLQQKLDINNNFIFANEHPVRERRHRLTTDQIDYGKKMTDTDTRLQYVLVNYHNNSVAKYQFLFSCLHTTLPAAKDSQNIRLAYCIAQYQRDNLLSQRSKGTFHDL